MTSGELIDARKALGLSCKGMADALGMTKLSIIRMENDRQPISLRTALQVSNLLALADHSTSLSKEHRKANDE